MLEKSFGLLFFLKQSKNHKKGTRYVYLRITVNGLSKELSTKRLCEPSRWSSEAGKAIGNKEDAKSLNTYLDILKSKVYDARRIMIESNKPVTAEALKNILSGNDENKKMILEIFQHHNEQIKHLVGNEFAPATLKRYKTSIGHARAFIQWKYGMSDLDIKRLDYEFISEYAFWFKSIRHCNHNTTMKYLGNFKKIVLRCVRNGDRKSVV